MLITLKEYAALHNRAVSSIRDKIHRGVMKTAVKMGRDWLIDSDEPYEDSRVVSGKYVGLTKKRKTGK